MLEKYELLKASMRRPDVRRKRGQTGAAKAKELIFSTTFPDPDERKAAFVRFDFAQATGKVLVKLCEDNGYGVLVLIPPGVHDQDLRQSAVEFDGFRELLRSHLSNNWSSSLSACGTALLAISKGVEPSPESMSTLMETSEASG
jgi:hypothetical protein